MTVRLLLFGTPEIAAAAGASAALPFERRAQLLAYLALKRSWVARSELAAMLWPGQAAKLALANLRKTLFRIQALPWAANLEMQDGALRFAAPTDVGEFDAALREGRIAAALPLRRGELLAGFDDDASEAWTNWLHFERDRLRVAWRGAALARLDGDIEPGAGIELAALLLESDPLDEAALRALMTFHARSGQNAKAREAYRIFAANLAADLGLAPGAELQSLHDALSAAGARVAPAPRAPASSLDADFVGRAAELRRIAALLAQDDCRLITIVGPGGAGKTRLAQRALDAAAAPATTFADGTLFVRLEDAAAPGEFAGRLASELEIALSGGSDPFLQVIAHLREQRMLLVLDNFEQLAAGAPMVGALLEACPRLKVIVTSRVRLAVAGEWLLPLEGLACPEAEDQDRVEAFDAARLFVNAARRVQPGLLPAAEAAAIVEICRAVEGLPLALELAAAWPRVLSCAAIAAELRRGTELLRAVDASRPARQRSVEFVFEQSWRLLSASEQDALARLSVFRGGFTIDAARAVAAAAIPVLGALADKSLLRKDDARLNFHPLVQQLAALRLPAGEARASTERAHAQYYQRLLAQLRRPVENGDAGALAQLEAEFENCRVAWRWSIQHGAADALAGGAPALFHFCDHRSRFEEGLALLGEARAAAAARERPALAALLAAAMAHLEYRLDRYAAAEAGANEALALAREAGDHPALAQCLQVLGSCALRLGRYADASRLSARARQHALSAADPRKAAANLYNQSLAEKSMGHYDEALRLSLQALAQQRRLGDVVGEALSLNNLGVLYFVRREYQAAGEHLRAGLAVCDEHGLSSTRMYTLANLTEHAVITRDTDAAARYAGRTLTIAESAGNRAIVSWMKLQCAHIALQRGDLADARAQLCDSVRIATAIARPALQLEGVCCLAEILLAQGEAGCARQVLAYAVAHPSIAAPEKDAVRGRLDDWPGPAEPLPAWPGMTLDELVERIVVESGIAYGALIALLRGGAQPAR